MRIRVSKSEVDKFLSDGILQEKTDFGNNIFQYSLKKFHGKNLSAEFTNGAIAFFVPATSLNEWATTNKVGIEHHLPVGDGNELYLLLEKDFKCIDADITEDQSDYFENPVKSC